jgi:hypothetical protein
MNARRYLKVGTVLLAGLFAVVALGVLDAPAAVEQKVGMRGQKGPIKSKGLKDGMKTMELKADLPKAMFEGTPKNIKPTPTLEKYIDKPRPPFIIPEGCTNVAKGKPVTSSDSMPIIGELDLVTDGDKEGTDGSYVELGPGLQWIQIDLKQTCEIYGILFWHYHAEGRVYHDVVIQVCDDPDFIEGVKTVLNNDYDNSSGLGIGKDLEFIEDYRGRLVDAGGVKGRYLRMYSAGNTSNDQNHYIEVEVYGKPAK